MGEKRRRGLSMSYDIGARYMTFSAPQRLSLEERTTRGSIRTPWR